jgi:hypothetical protein
MQDGDETQDDGYRLSPEGQQGLAAMALALLPGLWAWLAFPGLSPMEPPRPDATDDAPLFEANSGQFEERVAFMAQTSTGTAHVTRKGQVVYSLAQLAHGEGGGRLTKTLDGARPLAPVGGDAADALVSRFVGPRSYQAATYRNVHLGQAWPGVRVELAARGGQVAKRFHVAPHADAGQIRVRVDGALSLRLGVGGELIASMAHGDVVHAAPVACQAMEGRRVKVPARYAIDAAGEAYGFALGAHDPALPLVIAPWAQGAG